MWRTLAANISSDISGLLAINSSALSGHTDIDPDVFGPQRTEIYDSVDPLTCTSTTTTTTSKYP